MFSFRSLCLSIALLAVTMTCFAAGGGKIVKADPNKHFDPKGKMLSEFTIEFQNGQRKSLPFEDKRDFEEARKGFIAAPITSRLWLRPVMSPGTWVLTLPENI